MISFRFVWKSLETRFDRFEAVPFYQHTKVIEIPFQGLSVE